MKINITDGVQGSYGSQNFPTQLLFYFSPLSETLAHATNVGMCIQKSFWTGRLDRELQMLPLSATRCSYIAILCVSLVSFTTIYPFSYFLTSVYCCKFIFHYRLSSKTFGYAVIF